MPFVFCFECDATWDAAVEPLDDNFNDLPDWLRMHSLSEKDIARAV